MDGDETTAQAGSAVAPPDVIATAKAALRRQVSAERAARPAEERTRARAAVRAVVLDAARRSGWRCVAGYVPLRTEPGSVELLDELAALGAEVLVPVVRPDRDLGWARWPATGVDLGLDSLSQADAVLVPAFAVARDGTRLGRGGGSYDRALPRRRPGAAAIALLFDGELLEDVPHALWDVPVDAAVTPSGAFEAVGTDGGNTDLPTLG